MKTKIVNAGLVCWHLLTEVPGWPDAPRWMRWRRALPIIAPCTTLSLLLLWNVTIRDPRIQAARAAYQPLFALEEEITTLGLGSSAQQAAELAAKSADATKLLLSGPADLGPFLAGLKKEAASRQWEASFQAADTSGDVPAEEAEVIFLPVRGRVATAKGQPGSFPALIALLERFSSADKRIDLTRLAIRADEQGRYAVELNLRLACRRIHEKPAQ